MRRRREAPPGRLFIGAFTGFQELFDWLREALARTFGALDEELESEIFDFPETRTYARSMGAELRRKFYFLERPFPQDGLAAVKHRCLALEDDARGMRDWPVERPLNLDPGIINDCRVILASTKDYSHRIYRGDGIWEEITLVYTKGAFRVQPWTYPDFRQSRYHEVFEAARRKHLDFLKTLPHESKPVEGSPGEGERRDARHQAGERPTDST